MFAALSIAFLASFCTISSVYAAPTDVPSAASFYVPSIPDLVQDSSHPLGLYAGHISSDPNAAKAGNTDVTSHLFFMMVKNRKIADRQRIMFWFNGGPGCSSFDGLMMENGPWRFDENGELKLFSGGWEEYTTMVYIDQPAGTGYSYTSSDHYVHTLEEASEQFITFLKNFYLIFPEYSTMDTYIGGESYAGQYIPYFADAIFNAELGGHLRGIAIGNGWMDAKRQYPSYISYAVKHGLLEEKSEAWKEAKKKTDECVDELSKLSGPEPISSELCENLLYEFLQSDKRTEDGQEMCLNMYDVRLLDTSPACGMNWPKELANVTKYLDRQDVVNAIHANDHPGSWVECRGTIHQEFKERKSNSSITLLPNILERIPVLIFAGDQDLICNYVGLEAMMQAMTWNGETGFGTVQTQSWSVDGNPAGTWVQSRNLTYAKVFNASHMVSYDVPDVAHDMVLRFMGANFSALVDYDGSAKIPSALGDDTKPILTGTPENADAKDDDKSTSTVVSKVYNSGSSALVILLILVALGVFLWWRIRRRRVQLPVSTTDQDEEAIPLNTTLHNNASEETFKSRKGKERAQELSAEPIFDVGSDEEDGYRSDASRDKRRD